MKFYSTDSTPVLFTGLFKTPKDAAPLVAGDYQCLVETKEGEYSADQPTISIHTQRDANTNGIISATYTVPASAKGGVVTLSLVSGSPRKVLGAVQFYLLSSTADSTIEYTTESSISIPNI